MRRNNIDVKCPICRAKLVEADPDVIVEVQVVNEGAEGWIPDLVQKCWKCKNRIGIRMKKVKRAV